jgi:hypothetical protein
VQTQARKIGLSDLLAIAVEFRNYACFGMAPQVLTTTTISATA